MIYKSPARVSQGLNAEFKRYFGYNVTSYWDIANGFDIVSFCDTIECGEEESCEEAITRIHGSQATAVVKRLMAI